VPSVSPDIDGFGEFSEVLFRTVTSSAGAERPTSTNSGSVIPIVFVLFYFLFFVNFLFWSHTADVVFERMRDVKPLRVVYSVSWCRRWISAIDDWPGNTSFGQCVPYQHHRSAAIVAASEAAAAVGDAAIARTIVIMYADRADDVAAALTTAVAVYRLTEVWTSDSSAHGFNPPQNFRDPQTISVDCNVNRKVAYVHQLTTLNFACSVETFCRAFRRLRHFFNAKLQLIKRIVAEFLMC